jgi:hypothetical protein
LAARPQFHPWIASEADDGSTVIEEKRTGAEEGTRTSEFQQLFSPQENSDIY